MSVALINYTLACYARASQVRVQSIIAHIIDASH